MIGELRVRRSSFTARSARCAVISLVRDAGCHEAVPSLSCRISPVPMSNTRVGPDTAYDGVKSGIRSDDSAISVCTHFMWFDVPEFSI
jgi:hypothetical protein